MKAYLLTILIILQSFAYMGCRKDDSFTSRVPPPSSATGTIAAVNTAPIANAGPDMILYLPDSQVQLSGSFSDAEYNVQRVSWSKISGPASSFGDAHSATTILSQLEKGEYLLELTVIDSMGLSDKDTMKLTVRESPAPGETVFYDLPWIFPWYNSLEVPNINNYINPAIPFKVYVQRDNSNAWVEATTPISISGISGPYEYFIETRPDGAGMYNYGSLYIFYYGSDVGDTPNVKIVI